MLWARSSPYEVYLGTTITGVRSGVTERWEDVSGAAEALLHLKEVLRSERRRKRSARVWLSAGLARAFVVPAECGACNDSEVLAIAQAMAAESTGLTGELKVWSDQWRRERGCLAVALPAEILLSIREVCRSLEIRLTDVKPWWNLAINAVKHHSSVHRKALWSLSEPDGMTLGMLVSGSVASIDTLEPLPHDPNWEQTRTRASVGHASGIAHWHAAAQFKGEESSALPIGCWRVDASFGDETDRRRDARPVSEAA